MKERFARIASKYDFMNHLLSLNSDKKWRREAAREAMLPKMTLRVLDLGTGTGDLAFAIFRTAEEGGIRASIIGTDITPEMISFAKEKTRRMGIRGVGFKTGDAIHTGYGNSTFDVVTCGFLLRSISDNLGAFAREAYRVLKKGGKLVILDLAAPDNERQRKFFYRYSYVIRFLSLFADKEAYGWLVDSMKRFDKKGLVLKLRAAGFKNVRLRPLSSGIAYLATGEK